MNSGRIYQLSGLWWRAHAQLRNSTRVSIFFLRLSGSLLIDLPRILHLSWPNTRPVARGDSNRCANACTRSVSPTLFCDERAHAPARSGPTAGIGTICAFCGLCRFFHPDIPRLRTDFFIVKATARDLQRQLDLSLVIALVPDQMLKHEDRMVVVPIHRAA